MNQGSLYSLTSAVSAASSVCGDCIRIKNKGQIVTYKNESMLNTCSTVILVVESLQYN